MGAKQTYLPYQDAIQFVRKHSTATTRAQYIKWHTAAKPGVVPKYPNRVYDEWSSWNDWLGTTNSFEKTLARKKKEKRQPYRPFWEAVRYAQAAAKEYGLHTQDDWEEWYDSGMCAKDVPKRPHHEYDEFVGKGWPVWLGKNIEAKVSTAKVEVAVMAICGTPGQPANVVTAIVASGGLAALKDKWADRVMGKPYRIYKWEAELTKYVDRLFRQHAHHRGGQVWLVPNMNALLFDLDNILEYAVPPIQLQRWRPPVQDQLSEVGNEWDPWEDSTGRVVPRPVGWSDT